MICGTGVIYVLGERDHSGHDGVTYFFKLQKYIRASLKGESSTLPCAQSQRHVGAVVYMISSRRPAGVRAHRRPVTQAPVRTELRARRRVGEFLRKRPGAQAKAQVQAQWKGPCIAGLFACGLALCSRLGAEAQRRAILLCSMLAGIRAQGCWKRRRRGSAGRHVRPARQAGSACGRGRRARQADAAGGRDEPSQRALAEFQAGAAGWRGRLAR